MSYDQLTADVIKENAELKAKILAQEEELQKERNFVEAHRLLVQKLKTANQALESCAFEPTPIELSEEVTRLTADNEALRLEVAKLSGYLMRLVNEDADHQLEIHKLKNTLEANHVQMNPRQDEAVSWDRSLEFGWHRYWLTRTHFEQAANDANEMAMLVQTNIRELFEHDDMVGWEELPEWKRAQAIIDKYEGGQG